MENLIPIEHKSQWADFVLFISYILIGQCCNRKHIRGYILVSIRYSFTWETGNIHSIKSPLVYGVHHCISSTTVLLLAIK